MRVWFVFLCLLFSHGAKAQEDKTDSLYRIFEQQYKDKQKIKDLLSFVGLKSDNKVFFNREKLLLKMLSDSEFMPTHQPYLPDVWRAMGYFYVHTSRYREATSYFEKATEFYTAQKNYESLLYTWYQLALIFYRKADFQNTEKYLGQAEKYIQKVDTTKNYMDVVHYFNLKGLTNKCLTKYPQAIQCFEDALAIAEKKQNKAWIGILNGNKGSVYFEKGDYENALKGLALDVELSLQEKLYKSALNALSLQLEIFILQKKWREAKKIVQIMQNIKVEILDEIDFLPAYKAFANYYEATQKIPEALLYQKKIHALTTQKNEQKQKNEIAKLQAQYEFEQKEQIFKYNYRSEESKFLYYFLWITLSTFLIIIVSVFTFLLLKTRQQQRIITAQNTQLQEAINIKDKIFSIIGHDLRSPIGNLKALLDMYLTNIISKDEFDIMATSLANQVEGLHTTMNNLLLWASAQMQHAQKKPEHFEVQDAVTETVHFYESVAQQKNITLHQHILPDSVVWADQNQFKVILRNLISNALKFTPAGGKVSIETTSTSSDEQQLIIADTGRGMTGEELGKLFNLHTHFSKKGTAEERGTGLGLLLVKEYVEANRGRIDVKSEVSKGTTFTVTLPKSRH
jgi:signal transduction histidine kinase